ncbi:MAG: hypothetical protein LBK65_01635 [Tannerellaceae bacterium]|jgi:hypothetical protein|nr:hypothetical protein [Tannerellaceae bacterium]
MYADSLFPEVVSSYKERYKTGVRESFSSYCRRRHVAYPSVAQWMRRRGLSVSSLRLEVLLEQGGFPAGEERIAGEPLSIEVLDDLFNVCPPQRATGKETAPAGVDLLKGVTATFPDGLVVSIRQTTAVGLTKFIDSYNKLNAHADVQPY